VIVHGTNTLSYKVKILAKDQCFLRTLKDLKRDACSQHNYFFKNGLQAVHGSSIALIRTVSQNFLIGCKPGAFLLYVFFFLPCAPVQTVTDRRQMFSIFVLETGQNQDHRISFRREMEL
jgi:hypothetical protein